VRVRSRIRVWGVRDGGEIERGCVTAEWTGGEGIQKNGESGGVLSELNWYFLYIYISV